jgi:hypothetical protein
MKPGTYILVQAMRRAAGTHSSITRIDRYKQVANTDKQSMGLCYRSIERWKRRLGQCWIVIAAEVDHEEASEILADMEVGCE